MNLKESGGSIGFTDTDVFSLISFIVSINIPISPGATTVSE